MLYVKERRGENLVLRGARVLDPAEGIDAMLDVRIDNGVIAAVAPEIDAGDHSVVDATGLVLAPVQWRLALPEIQQTIRDAQPKYLFVGADQFERLDELETTAPPLFRRI